MTAPCRATVGASNANADSSNARPPDLAQTIATLWPHLVAAATLAITLWASGHAILHKQETRAAVGWLGVIWLVPIIGALLYFILGINRIKRIAAGLTAERVAAAGLIRSAEADRAGTFPLPAGAEHLASLEHLTRKVTGSPLHAGNQLTPLINGDVAYPRMLAAIDSARESISLCSFIFDYDASGREFIEALARARRRGVEVRVLIDAVGARYSFPWTAIGPLRRAGIPVARFMPTLAPWRMNYMNLRLHRKIMVIDGHTGFTGGMNIRDNNLLARDRHHPVQDLHFAVRGPVVADLQIAFAEDWAFTTREQLTGTAWFPPLEACGPVAARGVPDGPDEHYDKARMTLLGALSSARHSIRIVTPYFLPDLPLVHALHVAALRGVEVDILLPQKNNLRLVGWASLGGLDMVLQHGCRVWLTPPPFDHSKLMLVDGVWTFMGSANWDPRSLTLNFEFNVEAYDTALAQQLEQFVDGKKGAARQVTRADLAGRPMIFKLRDGIARLLSPYL